MNEQVIQFIKKGIWLYFFLLIFEGALRKWILPGLSSPLLLIRDPLAIGILISALRYHIWKPNLYVIGMWGVTVLGVALALILGHGNLAVALYGLRITGIHFPLIFIIGCVFKPKDVLTLARIMLWLTIGMTLLVAWQFFSPQSAWVNRGIGGDMEGSGFWGAEGFYRVPGTFSFTTGLAYFYGLAAAFVFYFWVANKKQISKYLLLASSLALLAAIPLSISRTILFEIAVSFLFMLVILKGKPEVVKSVFGAVVAGISLFLLLNNFSFFQTAISAFTHRFTTANAIEGGMVEGVLLDRFFGGMYEAIMNENFSFWGKGIGMGSSVGASLLVGDRSVYLIAEQEWGRVMGEMGFIMGIILILIRSTLVLDLLRKAWSAVETNNLMPWMLMSYGTLVILQGQWAQTTNLGFAVLAGGLVIASFKGKIKLS